ncbi:MAG: DNA replication/repair protein RecF [Alphaproteobacteria bacterium]
MNPGTSPARFAVTRLALTDYRCYANLRLETDARSVVLVGPNGAGKTNLLEAISFLAPGRGLRNTRLAEVDRLGGDRAAPSRGAWAVAATVATPDGELAVGTGRDPSAGFNGGGAGDEDEPEFDRRAEKRLVRLDGQPAKGATALGEAMSVLWLTPAMDRLFVEGAAGRRRFLDRLVFGLDPAHAGRVNAYEKAMRERAKLLRGPREGRGPADPHWLAALEQSMAERAVAIAAARLETVAALNAAMAEGLGPFPTAELAMDGETERWLAGQPALACEERLMAALAAARGHDAETGGAGFGPHRSDLAVVHAQRRMPAHLCSTGEQKALLTGIVLANLRLQARRPRFGGRAAVPVLLLDEVAAHLDEAHRRALFAEIVALGAQAWMTGTDAALFAPMTESAQVFRVAAATVSRVS